jgi:acetoin utilization deacetylase AcuC-like enzyme
MHESDIYPIPKAVGDLDAALPAGTGDETYLRLLREHLPQVVDRARPDIVFFQAGCDVLASDPLAGLQMSDEGVVQRDAAVIDECVRRSIPVVMTLGGGYSRRAWEVQYESIRRTLRLHGGRAAQGGEASTEDDGIRPAP